MLQGRHLGGFAGQRRVRLRIAVAEGAQVRLLGRQLLEGVFQLRGVLHGADDFERRSQAGVGRLREHARQRVAIPRRLLALHLLLEKVAEHRIPRGLAPGGHGVRRQRNGAPAEALKLAFGRVEALLRRADLIADDARQLGEPTALELRGYRDVALRDGVEDRRDANGIQAAQLDLEKVAVVIHPGVERVAQVERRLPRRLQAELDGVVGRQRVRGRRPQESEAAPDGVAHRPAVQHAPVQLREHVAVRAVGRETVVSGAELVSDVQGAEGGVGPLRHLQVQPLVAGHAIEDGV